MYVDHTGPRPGRRDRDVQVIHVAVDRDRRLIEPDGVRIHRVVGLDDRVGWNLGPPRIRYEHAVLDVAATSPTDLDAIAVLASACGSRRSTATRILDVLGDRPRQGRRLWLTRVLDDVAHGLPVGVRQSSHRHAGVLTSCDVEYVGTGSFVELDGRLFHDSVGQRDQDLERDLDAAASDGVLTIRLSWGQVFDRPCRTAAQIARVLQRRGWRGEITPCENGG